ncbi:MAG TPA: phage portal protein [Thermomicrobiales bacterium]|nr:phage portal protein [Thermomicrobiales bacterium]
MTLPANPLAWAISAFADGRNDKYVTYEKYLAGDQPLAFATDKFQSTFGQLFHEFAYNRCAAVVDAHADRLQVSGFDATDPDIAKEAQKLWEANQMSVREGHVYVDQFGDGDAYVLVDVHPETGDVQYWTQNPKSIRVHWDDERPNTIDLAAKMWDDDEKLCRVNLYFADRIEKYISAKAAKAGSSASLEDFTPYEVEGESWPVMLAVSDTVPVFHFANNARTNTYGVSELRSIIPLQDAINKSLMDLFVAMELAAFPQRVLIGIDKPETDEERELLNNFVVGMNKVLTMTDPNAKIAEFSAVNITQYTDVAEYIDKAICRVSKIPVHYLEMTGNFPSGRAQSLASIPFTKKMTDRTKADGAVWGDVQRYGVRLRGFDVKAGDIRVNWESVEDTSDDDVWDLITQQINSGVPLVTALRWNGYTEDEITQFEQDLAEYGDGSADFSSSDRPLSGDINPEQASADDEQQAA